MIHSGTLELFLFSLEKIQTVDIFLGVMPILACIQKNTYLGVMTHDLAVVIFVCLKKQTSGLTSIMIGLNLSVSMMLLAA